MPAVPQSIKQPASLNLTGASSEFQERGSRNIVSVVPAAEFQSYFEANRLKYAFFCDFTEKFPWPVNPTFGQADLAAGVPVSAFDKLKLPGFTGTDSAPLLTPASWVGYITKFIPFLIAYDVGTGARTHAYSAQLRVYNGNTLIGWHGGAGVSPDINDVYTTPITAGLTVGGTPGGTLTGSMDIKYTLNFTASPDPIRVEAFGLLYDVGILAVV